MSTPRRRVVVPLAVLAILAGTVWTVGGPADASQRCDGVWVVVDATRLGGGVTTRCAAGDPGSGLAALHAAGHDYAFVPRVPGMVCTIDTRPDPCNGAPTEAYWSYWHAPAGGSWTYSSRGAGNRDPAPGTVEGWAFGSGQEPGVRPPARSIAEPPPGSGGGDGEARRPGSSDRTGSGSSGRAGTGRAADSGGASSGSPGSGPTTVPEHADDQGREREEPRPDGPSAARSGGQPSEDADEQDGQADRAPERTHPARAAAPERIHPARAPDPGRNSRSTPAAGEDPAEDEVVLATGGGSPDGLPLRALAGAALVLAIGAAAVLRTRRRDDPEGV